MTPQTNPEQEVSNKPKSMFDVMYGSAESTTPSARQTKRNTTAVEPEAPANDLDEVENSTAYADASSDATELAGSADSFAAEEDAEAGGADIPEAGEVEEAAEEPSRYSVKVDGAEFEVSLDELRNGYQRQADYTRKSQSLAEQRKAYEANLSAVQQEREKYAKVLEQIGQQQHLELQKYANIDWSSLKESDPMQYMEKKLEYQEAREKQAHIAAERQRTLQRNRAEFQNVVTQKVQEETQLLAKALPDFVAPGSSLKNDLRSYAVGLGFTEQDIDSITDHRVILVLNKAMRQDRAVKQAPEKMIKAIPRVVKAGAAPESKEGKNRRDMQQRREQLARSGSVRDASRVFLDILNNPKPKR